MSAFQCSEAHVGAIVRFQFDNDRHGDLTRWHGTRVDRSFADRIIRDLMLENWLSVAHLYRLPIDKPETEWRGRPLSTYRKLTPVEALKAIHCLEYQSCEHDTWEQSEARKFLERATRTAIYSLPGYDDADVWDISDPSAAA